MQSNENNMEIGIKDIFGVINFYIEKFYKIILFSLVPFTLILAYFFLTEPILKNKSTTYSSNILIQDPQVISLISKDFFFSENNILEALERSNFLDKLQVDENLLTSFNIISGHSDLNNLISDYIQRDFASLTRTLYFKPEEIDKLLTELISDGIRFRVITFNLKNNPLSDQESSLLLNNLVNVINERIALEFDTTNIKLKKIPKLEVGNPVSNVDIIAINNRMNLTSEYIEILNENFESFAPDINLKVMRDELEADQEVFNYLVQLNNNYKEMVMRRIDLDLYFYEKQIEAVKNNLEILGFDSEETSIASEFDKESSLTADSTFINAILDLGDRANSMEQKTELMNNLIDLENSKINVQRQLRDINLDKNFNISFEDAQKYLVDSLNRSSLKINNYLETIKSAKKFKNSIIQLSMLKSDNKQLSSELYKNIILALLGSILFGFFIVSLSLIRQLK